MSRLDFQSNSVFPVNQQHLQHYLRERTSMTSSLLETFSPPHPPFPTASSFGTLVGGAHLMMSYLNKHFEPVPILCAVDFCLESRPVNPIVYLVKKK